MSVTIKDIAKLANVSHTTVSRALNNSSLINEETKKKIKEIAKELNYVPNYNAKSLVLHKSYTIGLFFTSITQGTSPNFFFDAIKGVNKSITDQYNLVVRAIDSYKKFSSINNKRFDGIILMSQSDDDNAFIYHVIAQGIPLVILDRDIDIESNNVVNILSNDKEAVFNAVEYIIENGHRDIAILTGKKEFKSTAKRKEGFVNALIKNKVQINDEYIVSGNYSLDGGYKAMQKLISLSKPPTAVFCSNDDMAIGAIKAIIDANLSIPEDISIIGFDDIKFSAYTTPSLTTIKRKIEKISEIGGEKILDMIDKKNIEKEKVFVETDFIIRDSVLDLK